MSNKTKMTIIFVAIIALMAAVIGVGVKVSKIEKTKELGAMSYTIGTIDTTGKEAKSDYALRTAYLEAKKFNKITIAENADITYQVFYYNADKEFIGKSNALSADMTEIPATQTVNSATENVKYYRVVILVPDTKDKVTLLNRGNYVKQLTVTVNK